MMNGRNLLQLVVSLRESEADVVDEAMEVRERRSSGSVICRSSEPFEQEMGMFIV